MKEYLETLKNEVRNIIQTALKSSDLPLINELEKHKRLQKYQPNMEAITFLKETLNAADDLQEFLLAVHSVHALTKNNSNGLMLGLFKDTLFRDLDNFFKKTLKLASYDQANSFKTIRIIKDFCKEKQNENSFKRIPCGDFIEHFDSEDDNFDACLFQLVKDMVYLNINLNDQAAIKLALTEYFTQEHKNNFSLDQLNKKIDIATEYLHAVNNACCLINSSLIALKQNQNEMFINELMKIVKSISFSFKKSLTADQVMPILIVSFKKLFDTKQDSFLFLHEIINYCAEKMVSSTTDHPLNGYGLFLNNSEQAYSLSCLQSSIVYVHQNSHLASSDATPDIDKFCKKILLGIAIQDMIKKLEINKLLKQLEAVVTGLPSSEYNYPSVITDKIGLLIAGLEGAVLKKSKENFLSLLKVFRRHCPKQRSEIKKLKIEIFRRLESMEIKVSSPKTTDHFYNSIEDKDEKVCKDRLGQLISKLTFVLSLENVGGNYHQYLANSVFSSNLLTPLKKYIDTIKIYLDNAQIVNGQSTIMCQQLLNLVSIIRDQAVDPTMISKLDESIAHASVCLEQLYSISEGITTDLHRS